MTLVYLTLTTSPLVRNDTHGHIFVSSLYGIVEERKAFVVDREPGPFAHEESDGTRVGTDGGTVKSSVLEGGMHGDIEEIVLLLSYICVTIV